VTDVHEGVEGARVAGYVVEELVGRGGMGEVYRARDERLERYVALKILAPRYAEDEGFRERLLRESRLAASLDHPNVVPVYDAGEADGQLYLAMRFVEGTDLKALLRREGVLDPARAVSIAEQVAAALDAAHVRGLVHRDVKPSNVLIDERGHCYLADFGLTQSVSDRGPTDGQLMGTVDYAAPEQIRGDDVDGRADVYSLGCLLFECLTGTMPFAGSSDVAVVYAHLQDDPPRASERVSALPPAVDDVVARAMTKEPDSRQPSCGALVVEARHALGLSESTRSRSRLWIAAVVAALALAVVGVALGLLVRPGSSPPPAASGGLTRIDAETGEVQETYTAGARPTHVTTEAGQVWFAAAEALWRLDPEVGRPIKVETVGAVHDLVGMDGQVYAARDGRELLSGIVTPYDARTGARSNGADVLACSLAAAQGIGLWAAGCPNVQQLRVTPEGLEIGKTVIIPYADETTSGTFRQCLCSMTTGAGSIWVVGDALDPRVWRISPDGRVQATIDLPGFPRAAAFAGGALWVTLPLDDEVVAIDAGTNRVARTVSVGRAPAGITSAGRAIWLVENLEGDAVRIDSQSGEITQVVDVEGHPFEIASDGTSLWVTGDA
jgi:YVTN family beta-propeller protein